MTNNPDIPLTRMRVPRSAAPWPSNLNRWSLLRWVASSTPLGWIIIAGLSPIVLAMVSLQRPLERRALNQQQRTATNNGLAADLLRGLRILKGLGAENTTWLRYRHQKTHCCPTPNGAHNAGWASSLQVTQPVPDVAMPWPGLVGQAVLERGTS